MEGFGKPLRGNVMPAAQATLVISNALNHETPSEFEREFSNHERTRIAVTVAKFLEERGLAIVQVVDPRDLKS